MDIGPLIDDSIIDPSHYLLAAKMSDHRYYQDFLLQFAAIEPYLSQFSNLEQTLREKLQIRNSPFHEKQFIQSACEMAVVSYFARTFPDTFGAEVHANPENKTDVDCRFVQDDHTFNIEVKCPDFDAKEAIENSPGYKFNTAGRLDQVQENKQMLESLLGETIQCNKKMDNNPLLSQRSTRSVM